MRKPSSCTTIVVIGLTILLGPRLAPAQPAATAARVEGTVTDAETGQPVARLSVVPGRGEAAAYQLSYVDSQECENGRFEHDVDAQKAHTMMRVEADGYAPVALDVPKAQDPARLEFKLRRAPNLAGRVLTPDGKPAADADVIAATPHALVVILGAQASDEAGPRTTTDADGNFSMPPTGSSYRLVVLHKSGYAEIAQADHAADKPIPLSPWARIDGTAMVGAAPAADALIVLATPAPVLGGVDPPQVHVYAYANTDDAGRFVFERLPPREVTAARQMPFNVTDQMQLVLSTAVTSIDLKSGVPTKVQVGGRGRPVTGLLALPDAASNWVCYGAALTPLVKNPGGFQPPRYAAEVEAGGAFRIDDVEPGRYQFRAQFHERNKDGHILPIPVAVATADVTVPDLPAGTTRLDEALEIGEIEPKPAKSP